MRNPDVFCDKEASLDQFVISADTTTLDSACDLLFINAHDLTWGEKTFGLFLLHVNTDQNFDEVVELVEARSKLCFASMVAPILRPLEPRLIKIMAEVAPELEKQVDPEERKKVIGRALAAELINDTTQAELSKLAPQVFGLDQWIMATDAMASSLLRDAVSLRRRQLACTGKSEDEYGEMLYALTRLNLCDRIAQVAYAPDSLNLELSVASQGEFRATAIVEGSSVIEWQRVNPEIESLKRDEEKALPLFISRYINSHYVGDRQSFACARYRGMDRPDIDVAVPRLKLGFEVKLYQAPFAQTDNKLIKLGNDLGQQLPAYIEAGCEHVVYVCNLSQQMAETVVKIALEKNSSNVQVLPIGDGLYNLLPVLEDIGRQLEVAREAQFEQQALKHAVAKAQKV